MAAREICAAVGAARRIRERPGDGAVQPAFSANRHRADSDGSGAAIDCRGIGGTLETQSGNDCRMSSDWPSIVGALKSLQVQRAPIARRWTVASKVGFALSTRDRFTY